MPINLKKDRNTKANIFFTNNTIMYRYGVVMYPNRTTKTSLVVCGVIFLLYSVAPLGNNLGTSSGIVNIISFRGIRNYGHIVLNLKRNILPTS